MRVLGFESSSEIKSPPPWLQVLCVRSLRQTAFQPLPLLAVGKYKLGLGIDALRTLSVLGISFGSQATTYGAAVVFGLVLDGIKIPVFARLGIS